jgi:hypothetical protein
MEEALKTLLATYGSKAVYESLQKTMKEEYTFLQSLFSAPSAKPSGLSSVGLVLKERVVAPVAAPVAALAPLAPLAAAKEETAPAYEKTVLPSKNTVVQVKKVSASTETVTPEPELATEASKKGKKKKEPVPLSPPEPVAAETVVEKQPTPQEIKAAQRAKEQEKAAELRAKGITIDSVLTKDNLKQWIEVDGRSYSFIAREYAGCPDTQVAALAKGYGLVSKVSQLKQAKTYK